LTFKLNNAIII